MYLEVAKNDIILDTTRIRVVDLWSQGRHRRYLGSKVFISNRNGGIHYALDPIIEFRLNKIIADNKWKLKTWPTRYSIEFTVENLDQFPELLNEFKRVIMLEKLSRE